ncbi:RNA methyltransferase, putative [Plasmodium gallinaceum]|uniref:RNA methyltransferase, putative n=1 Tax=Plasmodium gallinaceum TaxID=5849 RepID=A0A1J1GYK8_PLAGA|nr:RNA methyltransferase, putative [Plasmodium gallinaceum]CRG97321.1 RNA methyltransferase, putative [Plasmodium gallinaceum]
MDEFNEIEVTNENSDVYQNKDINKNEEINGKDEISKGDISIYNMKSKEVCENIMIKNNCDKKINMYVVIYNISKKKNVGSIIRSCVAFNVSKIFIIGRKKKEINFFGNMGTYQYISIEYFDNIIELKDYLKKNNILLYGCEITNNSISVTKKPFIKDTAFLFGNEGTGIEDKILNLCDKIIYIPQYGNGTSSLNVSISCSIILHNFAIWANYKEIEIENKKFIIQKNKNKLDNYLHPSDDLLKEINNKRLMRSEKKKDYNFFE